MKAPLPDRQSFHALLRSHGLAPLHREIPPRILQVNVGKRCNQACHHCHVDAGPKRTEVMTRATAERVIRLLAGSYDIREVDLTGGAPELNPNFKFLVEESRKLNRSVIVRCNLTVLFEAGMEWLADFYQRHQIHLICSLPCYSRDNVERQRGRGVFDKSIEALQQLNRLGYGDHLRLDLVYNPLGPSLPPAQAQLEDTYRQELGRDFGIRFHRLLTIANMPINRFAQQLCQWNKFSEYMSLLVNHFNPATVGGVMCRELVSVGWNGQLYDCDFNQMLEIPIAIATIPLTIWDIENADALSGRLIATASHCFGCTAGAGSSCGGSLT